MPTGKEIKTFKRRVSMQRVHMQGWVFPIKASGHFFTMQQTSVRTDSIVWHILRLYASDYLLQDLTEFRISS